MKVLKFGGTSVGDVEIIRKVLSIIENAIREHGQITVVLSAFKGVTNQLITTGGQAAAGNVKYLEQFKELEKRHISTTKELISAQNQSSVVSNLIRMLNELEDVLHGVYLIREISPRTMDFIMSFGERFSAYIICNALLDRGIDCEFLDSRELVRTNNQFGAARVDLELTNRNIREYFKTHRRPQITTGFIASTADNETTTLGRGGSDFTASILGAALGVPEIEIWTDVDGVLTADPGKVSKAFTLPHLTYEEAMELSHFGAKVLHPATMQPALENRIPLIIKNTFNPGNAGTVISDRPEDAPPHPVRGISSIDDISLVRVQGSGMVGVAGIAHRIFKATAQHGVNVILITQASSEHSVCFAVLPDQAASARAAIETELRHEIRDRQVNEVVVENSLSIIAVVGENMRKTPGISGRLFQALGKNGVNIVAIAQGSSERNISVVVSRADESKALNVLHDAFFLSPIKTANLFLVGTGLIGGTLLQQVQNQAEYLEKEYALRLNVAAMTNTRKLLFDAGGISLEGWQEALDSSSTPANLDFFLEKMKAMNLSGSIFVDCTASDAVISRYPEIFESNISIVTPNKKANSAGYRDYLALRRLALKHNVRFAYEANVGAGLPIINTLKDLISSGDKILKIEGVLSGTLSYIFNTFGGGQSFSETIREAKEKGYTEPDPREDLSGTDVARKLLILAREIGIELELDNIKVENLVPEPLRGSGTVEAFLSGLPAFDSEFEELQRQAEERNCRLRYIAGIEAGVAETALREVDASHPFYRLYGSDNILAFTTRHCQDRPIVVQGPGAGADVTAAGVFADILRIANYLY